MRKKTTAKLTAYRKKIDEVDKKLILLLEQRLGITRKIGEHKKRYRIKVKDTARENQILKKTKSKHTREIFKKILLESRRMQK